MCILWPHVLSQSRSVNSKQLVSSHIAIAIQTTSKIYTNLQRTGPFEKQGRSEYNPNSWERLLHEPDTRKRYTHTCSCRDSDSDLQLYNPQGWRHQRFRPREPHLISRIALCREDPHPLPRSQAQASAGAQQCGIIGCWGDISLLLTPLWTYNEPRKRLTALPIQLLIPIVIELGMGPSSQRETMP